MRVAVVIPATDGRPTLSRVLAAVRSADEAPDEIIVVNEPPGIGPAAARNRGSRQTACDVLVFVDADVEVHHDAFVLIRQAFERDPSLAAIFGSYDDDPGGGSLVSSFRDLLHHHVHHKGAGEATSFWAGLGAIRRDVFVELDGFDEARYARPSVEDIELGARLAGHGARILLDPSIQGRHLKQWTLGGMVRTDLLHRGIPWLRLVFEGNTPTSTLNLGWGHRLSTAASVVLVLGAVKRRLGVVVAALAMLAVLDWPFYRLLARRGGIGLVSAGFVLHVVHRLTAVVAFPVAVVEHLRRERTR